MSNRGLLNQWIENWCRVSAEGLGLMRIFSSLFILFFLIPGEGALHFAWLSTMPADFFSPPPGPMMILDQFPPFAVFQAIHTILMVSLIAMLAGYRTKWASILTGVSILLLQGLIFSVGKVNHEILIAVVPAAMAFSNWGGRFSIDSIRKEPKNSEPESWPLLFIAILIAFMMFTAGFPKILGGWLDPSTQATYGHLLNQFFVKERQDLLAAFFVQFDNVIFWEFLDWATILFEVGFLVSVFKLKWFRIFLCFAVLFHFSTMMSLNIAFLPNFLAYALFLNWDRIYTFNHQLYKRATGKLGERSKHRSVLAAALILVVLFAIVRWMSSMNLALTRSDLLLHEVVFISGAVLVVVVMALMTIRKKTVSQHQNR
ncbi:MAG: hypothetical protein EA390_12895 [Balneolaceae bacterium]|nr:MAG: hypothetical protein EA390_12895 [Balneolaceae bacterium]